MTFSFIVPVYNTERYLSECMDSLLGQSCTDAEILLVDDGSTDTSPALCGAYAARDSRVRLLTTAHCGLSAARNAGMDAARGDYLIFVDSDDVIASDTLEQLFPLTLSRPDVIISQSVDTEIPCAAPCGGIRAFSPPSDGSRETALSFVFGKKKHTWMAQQYPVRREFVQEKSLRFREGFLHEDIDWTPRIMAAAESFVFCSAPWYRHRVHRSGAITTAPSLRRVLDILSIADLAVSGEALSALPELLRQRILSRMLFAVMESVQLAARLDRAGRKAAASALRDRSAIVRYASGKKQKFFRAALRFFGPRTVIFYYRVLARAGVFEKRERRILARDASLMPEQE